LVKHPKRGDVSLTWPRDPLSSLIQVKGKNEDPACATKTSGVPPVELIR